GGPEHEAELAPPETVWKRRFGPIVVAVELGFEELRRRFLRAIRDRHGAPSESRPYGFAAGPRPRSRHIQGQIRNTRIPVRSPMDRRIVAWAEISLVFLALYLGVPLA